MTTEETKTPQKKKRPSWQKIVFGTFGIVVAVVAALTLLLNLIVIFPTERSIYEKASDIPEGSYDCILILGCGVKPDGTPSDMLADRISAGVALYKAGIAPKLLMTGDHGESDYNEVAAMKKMACELGVPEEDIFLDHAGLSTYKSMARAAEVFGVKSCVVVTQRYHLTRALYTARFWDIEAVGYAADLRSYAGQEWRDLREMASRCKAVFDNMFRPYYAGGDPIDIHGDGRVTDDTQNH